MPPPSRADLTARPPCFPTELVRFRPHFFRSKSATAYKIDYVNYICSLNVEKLIMPALPLSKAQRLGHLEP